MNGVRHNLPTLTHSLTLVRTRSTSTAGNLPFSDTSFSFTKYAVCACEHNLVMLT